MYQECSFVSVIVPAYNSAATLGICLSALENQTYPRAGYEIIVVDDGSTDNTAEVAKDYGTKVLLQTNQGAASARNLGAKAAKGEIVLFTDADCEPLGNWVAQMVRPFSDPEVVGAKGFYKTRQSELIAHFAQAEYDIKCERLKRQNSIDFIDTYSAAYRRDVFLDAGGFDVIYTTASGEDSELSYRLSLQGYRMVPVLGAFVYHLHPNTLWKYLKKKYRNAYWRVVTWRKHPTKIVRDSHTPLSYKLEVVLVPLFILSLAGALVMPSLFLWISMFLWVLFLVLEYQFWRALAREPRLLLVSPFLLLLRGATAAGGAAVRVLEILLGRRAGAS
jgi:cellulose synthase/poly-beta-1,6-N-acetylglucosamine synthase-like glycosyltransferase